MYRFGPFEVDFSTSELRKSGHLVRIQEQPLRILQSLLERPGELASREQLKDRLWPSDTFVDFERSLNAGVAKLRQALNDSADNSVYVETVARKGYRFVAPVTLAVEAPREPIAAPSRQLPNVRSFAFVVIMLAFTTIGGLFALWSYGYRSATNSNNAGSTRFTVTLPEDAQIADAPYVANMDISPDGRVIAIVVSQAGGPKSLWLRPLSSEVAHRLDGTNGATLPFWSPDGKEIAFFADGWLKRISASGGPVKRLCDSIPAPFGGTWGRKGVILYSAGTTIRRVDANGGQCTEVTRLFSEAEFRHAWPHFLPNGERFRMGW